MTDNKFSWVETHKQIAHFLYTKENSQKELIEILKSVGIGPFNDQATKGVHDTELEEIDPFTFFCYIYKYGPEKRLKYLQEISKKINVSIPSGESGIPSAQAQQVWLFPYKYYRKNNEVARLWNFFKKAVDNKLTNSDFQDVLQISSTGKTKLTEALFYINPEKYLPINGPTKPYIKEVLEIDPQFKTYSEYIDLLEKIKRKTDLPFYELSFESWNWNNEQKAISYWIFQGNPNVFDFETALKEEILTDWTVNAHKDKIKVGDKVILWITGNQSGCYALGEVTSEPHQKAFSPDDHLWKENNKSTLKAEIKITHNLVNNPILKEDIIEIEGLKNLKVGNQGTNFKATQKEYEIFVGLANKGNEIRYWLYAPGENARNWEEFYEKGIMGLGWDNIGDLRQYSSRDQIKQALIKAYPREGSKMNDVLANDDFLNKVKVGDIVIAKKGRGELLGHGIVKSEYEYDNSRSEYQKIRKVEWQSKGNWKVDFSLVLKTLTDITKYASEHPDYDTYYERLLGIMSDSKSNQEPQMEFPLNSIFYGPPGTGKTYNTVLRAAEIIENRKINSYNEALLIFKANLHDRIEFITFHQNYSYEDFIQGLRPDIESDNGLIFERKDGVFKQIADKALKNINESMMPSTVKMPFDKTFNVFFSPLIEGEVEEIEVRMVNVSYFITGVENISINFRKASGNSVHTLSIATLRRMYEAESVLDIQGLTPYYEPLLNALLKIGKDKAVKKEIVTKQNYVIIIDEINRANISRVFGELITLIEPDKRSHGSIAMEARLPSGETFIVPSNLYIIGTMNTADKSIALLDIALRRRFEFEAMYPLYEIEGFEIYDEDILRKINEQILKSKGHDFQIGHAYFMGENRELIHRMNKKVIPLLLEYYMNDEKEVKGILYNAGLQVDENTWPIKITGRRV